MAADPFSLLVALLPFHQPLGQEVVTHILDRPERHVGAGVGFPVEGDGDERCGRHGIAARGDQVGQDGAQGHPQAFKIDGLALPRPGRLPLRQVGENPIQQGKPRVTRKASAGDEGD